MAFGFVGNPLFTRINRESGLKGIVEMMGYLSCPSRGKLRRGGVGAGVGGGGGGEPRDLLPELRFQGS